MLMTSFLTLKSQYQDAYNNNNKLFMYSPHCSHIFVKLLVGRICLNIKECIFGDHLLDSHVLYIWLSSDLVRRNQMLVAIET